MAYQGLTSVKFGHIAAEDEAGALRDYFLETKEYSDLLADDSKILVIGRKGSGKSAIYVAVRDQHFAQTSNSPLSKATQETGQSAELLRILNTYFSESELRDLAFDLNIDYEDLLTEGKANKARELILLLRRKGRISELIDHISYLRPHVRLTQKRSDRQLSSNYRGKLLNLLVGALNGEDIINLSFKLNVDYEYLGRGLKRTQVIELISYLERRNRILDLIEVVEKEFPWVQLDTLFEEAETANTLDSKQQPTSQIQSYSELLIAQPNEKQPIIVEALTLQDYPWELHKKVRDSGVPVEQTYVNSWKYVIWVLLAKKLLGFDEPSSFKSDVSRFWKRIVDPNLRYIHRFLKQNYGSLAPSFSEIISDRASRIKALKVVNFEVEVDAETDPSQHLSRAIRYINRTLQSRVIAVASSNSKYFLLFDQLDLGWDDSSETKQLLIGLILAARDVVRAAKDAGKQIRVVLFLRSDIYESLRFEDKNKLSPSIIELTWNEKRLKRLVSKRIEVSSEGYLEDVFTYKGTGQARLLIDYMIQQTMMRPRDIIQYCTFAKESASSLGQDMIDESSVRAAIHPFSDHMRKEVQDEAKASLPVVDHLLAILKDLGTARIMKEQLLGSFHYKGLHNFESALQQLISLGVLGVCRAGKHDINEKVIYHYEIPLWDTLDPTDNLIVHPSLIHALDLKN